ncbi:MAG: hypothetical protein R3F59_19970 [Myxococcota bacterium]
MPRLAASFAAGSSKHATERIEALGDDPRVVQLLFALFDSPPYSAETTRPFWRAALARLEALAGPADVPAIEARSEQAMTRIPTAVGIWLGNQLGKVAKRVAERPDPAPLDGDDAEAADALEAALGGLPAAPGDASVVTEADLLAAVYADPQADGPRRIFGDFLLDRGDPWGELVALQYGARDPAREAALVRDVGPRALGPLAAALNDVRFDRGFPDWASVWRAKVALPKVVGVEPWRTVRTFRTVMWPRQGYALDRQAEKALRAIVDHEVMTSLEAVVGITPTALTDLLAARPRTWRHVAVRPGRDEALDLPAWFAALPALRDFALPLLDQQDDAVLASLCAHGGDLRTLEVTTALSLAAWLPALREALSLETLRFTQHNPHGIGMRLDAGPEGPLTVLTIEAMPASGKPYPAKAVAGALAGLPPGMVREVRLTAVRLGDSFHAPDLDRPPLLPDDAQRATVQRAVEAVGAALG